MRRRKFIQTSIGVASAGLLTGTYSWQIEPFWVEFVHRKMPIHNLPKDLVGKTIIQISDIHIGNRFDYNYIIGSFKKAQQLQPDYVVYTGDYVTYENEEQYAQLEDVLKHAVKGKIATIGILGNHDYGKNWSQKEVAINITNGLKNNGINILRNEQVETGGINFIGIDDYWGTNFNPNHVLKHYNSENANIVLCHNPDVCDLNIWKGYKGWILSGHTHGGQCKAPFLNPPILPVKNKKYSSGEIDLKDGRSLYINRALGHLWQVRFNVRPEITVFTLSRAD